MGKGQHQPRWDDLEAWDRLYTDFQHLQTTCPPLGAACEGILDTIASFKRRHRRSAERQYPGGWPTGESAASASPAPPPPGAPDWQAVIASEQQRRQSAGFSLGKDHRQAGDRH